MITVSAVSQADCSMREVVTSQVVSDLLSFFHCK